MQQRNPTECLCKSPVRDYLQIAACRSTHKRITEERSAIGCVWVGVTQHELFDILMDLQQQSSSPSSTFSSSEGIDDPPSSSQICPLPCSFHPLVEDLRSSSSSRHHRIFGFRLLPKRPRSKSHPPKRKNAEGISSSRASRMQRQNCSSKGKHKEAGNVCGCVAGFSADCAAICCCPLVLLHVLALVIFRLPAAIAIKITAHFKKNLRRNRNLSNSKEKGSTNGNPSSPWPYMSEYFSEQMVDRPAVEFQDEKFLREYFECKQLGFGGLS